MTTTGPSTEPRLGAMDARLVAALVAVALSAALMGATAFFVWGARFAVSVEVGGAVAASNLYVLSRIVHGMTDTGRNDGNAGASGAAWGLIFLGKMLVLFGGIWWVMARGLANPLGLVVGYGSLPIGIAIGSIVSDKTDPRR
jgi:hypothetical protein